MTYDVIALACEKLSYRDKLRLAQLLIQEARKEEENSNPQNRSESEVTIKSSKITKAQATDEIDTFGYVVERLLKLRPSKKKTLVNSIRSMFQFQGGISEADIDTIIDELEKRKHIKIEQNSVCYL
jgi:uncharacterized protein YfeS